MVNMTLSPLLHEYFFHECNNSDAIRVHCPLYEQREALSEIASMVFDDFITDYLHDSTHHYIFWNRDMQIGQGFDAYLHKNDHTYEFEDFIQEVFVMEDPPKKEILDVEELL